jgi:hypothetical protein
MNTAQEIMEALADAHEQGLDGIYVDADTGQIVDISNVPELVEVDMELVLAELLQLLPPKRR